MQTKFPSRTRVRIGEVDGWSSTALLTVIFHALFGPDFAGHIDRS
jgi:hypothetical protein